MKPISTSEQPAIIKAEISYQDDKFEAPVKYMSSGQGFIVEGKEDGGRRVLSIWTPFKFSPSTEYDLVLEATTNKQAMLSFKRPIPGGE